MWADLFNTGIGLVLGLVTGFYFEHRSSKETRQHNAELEERLRLLKLEARQNTSELEEELAKLRVGVYTTRGGPSEAAPAVRDDTSLRDSVLSHARQIQDADGRLSRTLLTSHFFAAGHRTAEIDAVVRELCEDGSMRRVGKWLEVR